MTPLWQQKYDLIDECEKAWFELYEHSSEAQRKAMLSGLVRRHANDMGINYMRKWLTVINNGKKEQGMVTP